MSDPAAAPHNTTATVTTDPGPGIVKVARILCSLHGLTHGELAKRIGVKSRSAMSDRMRGYKPFTAAEITAMAALFGVTEQTFYDGPGKLLNVPASGGEAAPGQVPPPAGSGQADAAGNGGGTATTGLHAVGGTP
jgi:hypothetical protein